jgi:hypothetical protein
MEQGICDIVYSFIVQHQSVKHMCGHTVCLRLIEVTLVGFDDLFAMHNQRM